MTIILITAGGILLVFLAVVIFLKIKDKLPWAVAVREAFEYLWTIFF